MIWEGLLVNAITLREFLFETHNEHTNDLVSQRVSQAPAQVTFLIQTRPGQWAAGDRGGIACGGKKCF